MNLLQCRTPEFWRALLQGGIWKIKSSHDGYKSVWSLCSSNICVCLYVCVHSSYPWHCQRKLYKQTWMNTHHISCLWLNIHTSCVIAVCVYNEGISHIIPVASPKEAIRTDQFSVKRMLNDVKQLHNIYANGCVYIYTYMCTCIYVYIYICSYCVHVFR